MTGGDVVANEVGQEHSAGIAWRQAGAAAIIGLARPAALNAITMAMRRRIAELLPPVSRDVMTYILLIESRAEGAFCAGGDLRELSGLVATEPVLARESFRDEYKLNWMLECFSKPSIALIDGLVIGGGNGLTMFATHRVAGERYSFSMPETAIGFFPDDGLAHFLARMPHAIGIYLGLTGRSVAPADALHLGLATHTIPRADFPRIEALMAEAEPVDRVLDELHRDPGPAEIVRLAPVIERCFSAASVEEIIARLARTSEERAWCDGVVADLEGRSPLALKVTLRHIRNAATLDIRHTLQVDYRLACRLMFRPDFREGVRARLIDRDNRPVWEHRSLGDVSAALVDDCFAAMPGEELVLPTREEMQAHRI